MTKCKVCDKEKETAKTRTVKENGYTGYYDIEVTWCDDCVKSHNYYLMASWG